MAGALLGVVDDDDGDGVAALQLAQTGEQRRHFAAGVLIDAMQAHEGIEDEQARAPFGDGRIEASAVDLEIQPHGGCGDDLDVEIGEAEAGGGADAVEPPAHDVERVLGGVKQNAPGAWHGEATQARNACRDRPGVCIGLSLWVVVYRSDSLGNTLNVIRLEDAFSALPRRWQPTLPAADRRTNQAITAAANAWRDAARVTIR